MSWDALSAEQAKLHNRYGARALAALGEAEGGECGICGERVGGLQLAGVACRFGSAGGWAAPIRGSSSHPDTPVTP